MIATKRGFTVKQIVSCNPGINPDNIKEGQTILLPGEHLSIRDKEILSGIGPTYRIYPVRKGEVIDDIITKRKITVEEMESLNPGIRLDKLHENQLLKLPSGKFTVREREMLIGSGILPKEFFEIAKSPFAVGIGALLLVCGFVLAWQRFYNEDEDEEFA